MRTLALAALLAAAPVRAADVEWDYSRWDGGHLRSDWAWTRTDTALELTFLALVFLDWQGTRWALYDDPQRSAVERNPFLGSHPSKTRLDLTVAGAAVGHAVAARLIPWPYRRLFHVVSISVEGWTVWENTAWHGGVRFSF